MARSALNELLQEIDMAQLWAPTITLKRGDFLRMAGSIETHIYLVSSGSFRIYFMEDTEEHTTRLAYRGNIITALDSFVSGKPTRLYIQVLRKAELKPISKAAFEAFLGSSPRRTQLWVQLLQEFIYQQIERELDLLIQSPAERYRRVLARSPHLFQEIPSKYIAAYLRMNPETLSRLKRS